LAEAVQAERSDRIAGHCGELGQGRRLEVADRDERRLRYVFCGRRMDGESLGGAS
jgi:hypothetical protein